MKNFTIEDIAASPNKLAGFYSKFNVGERLLLTGHSHQAWPDVAFDGVVKSFQDAAIYVDEKWGPAFEKAEVVRKGFAEMIDDNGGFIALAQNTHDLIIRFLSALDLKSKPRIITSDGEFHTIRRQLSRLEEEGIEIIRIQSDNMDDIAPTIISEINDRTSAVMISKVFFRSGLIFHDLKPVAEKCSEFGVPLLVDAYHAVNVAPFSVAGEGLEEAFVVGGGYKYCQLGEGNCFLRFPRKCSLRPVITGWFSEFSTLSATAGQKRVQYGTGPDLFAGSTYDPVSHYRAAEVFRFFADNNLTPGFLRKVSQHQIKVLINAFDSLDLNPVVIKRNTAVDISEIAGFLVLESPFAGKISKLLLEHGVYTDSRGESLRLGPAPYLSDEQLSRAVGILGDVVRNNL